MTNFAWKRESKKNLIRVVASVNIRLMNLFLVILVWLVMGAVLATGIVLATKGILWLLILSSLAFIAAFAKWGCATH